MKKWIFVLVGALLLVPMVLPSSIPEVLGRALHNQTATNQTAINVTNESPLIADFDSSVCPLCSSATRISVAFTDQSTGGRGRYGYKWDFGDGSTSRVKNPTHYYTAAGNYTVTLTVTDRARNVANTTQTITLELGANTESVDSNTSLTGGGGSWPRQTM
jgi:PKD repeat protein